MQIASRLIELGGSFSFLCATSVFSVSLWLVDAENESTTETQRTQWTCLDFVDTLKDPDDTFGQGGVHVTEAEAVHA